MKEGIAVVPAKVIAELGEGDAVKGREILQVQEQRALPLPALRPEGGRYSDDPEIQRVIDHPELIIWLPHFKPVGKKRHRYDPRRGGHMHPDSKSESYERQLGKAAKIAMIGRRRWEAGEALVVLVEAVFPPPKSWSTKKHLQAIMGERRHTGKPDCDNLLKASLDPLNEIVFKDDAQVIDARVIKRYGIAVGLTIRVKPA